jgi:uncharacterized protein (DUF2235 family)
MKRIITCSDGTWNKPNTTSDGVHVQTNVQRMFDYIDNSANSVMQVKYYDEGIGAEGSMITRILNGATGKGIDQNILDAYKFICWNYVPGDELYLFGFSRGAYTARSLAGLIRKCGLLKSNDLDLFASAYQLYRNKAEDVDSDAMKTFRQKYSNTPKIKFIGVWDTVGSLGIPLNAFQWFNKKKYAFYDTTLSNIVDYAYHAVSIDEKRSNFEPTLWTKSPNMATNNPGQVLEQVWFAGVHSNIGGGYPDRGLSDITLRWMMEKAAGTGLGFCISPEEIKGNPKGVLYDSRTGIYKIRAPYTRLIDKDATVSATANERIKEITSYRPNNPEYFNVNK